MLEIRTPKGSLILPKDISVGLELISPYFASEIGRNSWTYSTNIPHKGNGWLLQYPGIAAIASNPQEIEASLFFSGIELYQGKLKIQDASSLGNTISIALIIDEKNLKDSLEGIEMSDVEFQEIVVSNATNPENRHQEVINHATDTVISGNELYVFAPVLNEGKWDEDNAILVVDSVPNHEWTIMNYWDGINQKFHSIHESFINNWDIHYPGSLLVPLPYILPIISSILEAIGYHLEESSWTSDEEIKTLVCLTNKSLAEEENTYYGLPTHFSSGSIRLGEHIPNVSPLELVSGIAKLFNLAIEVKGKEVTFLPKKDLLVAELVDWTEKCLSYSIRYEDAASYSFASDNGSDSLFHPEIETRPNTETEVQLLSDLPQSPNQDDIVLVRFENAFYKYQGAQWNLLTHNQYPLKTAKKPKTELNIPIGTTRMKKTIYYNLNNQQYTHRIPRVSFRVDAKPFGQFEEPIETQLLFFDGLQSPDQPLAGDYPRLRSDSINGQYNYSLFWDGSQGLYAQWWQAWIQATNRPIIKVKLLLKVSDLLKLDFKKRIQIQTETSSVIGLLRKLSVTLGNQGVISATAEILLL